MDAVLGEVQARQALQRFRQLTGQVKVFTAHADTLRKAKGFEARLLLGEADTLLKGLMASRSDFEKTRALATSLSRSLSSRPPPGGGMSAAQKWRPEFNAGAKQFAEALHGAEKAIQLLYKDAHAEINLPTRTSTDADGWFDAVLVLCQILAGFADYCKRLKNSDGTPQSLPGVVILKNS